MRLHNYLVKEVLYEIKEASELRTRAKRIDIHISRELL